jgi:glycosyltransferase involved in cell wall biosynthesis
MRNILYLVTSTNIGGTERSLLEICRRLDRSRYHPTVVSLKREGPVAPMIRESGVEVLSLGMRESADWLSSLEFGFGVLRLPRLVRGKRFDIAHSFLYRANILARLAAPRCGIAKIVNSVRVTADEESPLMKTLDRHTVHRADRVCFLSEALARTAGERLGIPADHVSILPNSIDTSAAGRALEEAAATARAGFDLSHADLVIATVGRLHRQKGLDTLLEAFRPLALEHPRGHLLLAGEGPERLALEGKARALGIADRVSFIGSVEAPWKVLSAADIFVLPSLYEGMPNALLEAMAASLPVVATTVGAVPEMLENGREGILVPPGEPQALTAALERLAWSADLRSVMGRRGFERVKRDFSPDVTMRKLDELYESLFPGEAGR